MTDDPYIDNDIAHPWVPMKPILIHCAHAPRIYDNISPIRPWDKCIEHMLRHVLPQMPMITAKNDRAEWRAEINQRASND